MPAELEVKGKADLIDEDITRSQTLPARFYRDPAYFDKARSSIFTRSWHYLADADRVNVPGHVLPASLLEGYLNEPLILTRDAQDQLNCLANVCTHRGSLLVEGECHTQSMRCRYHGRRFGLNGDYLSAPGFENAKDFPSDKDNLARVPMEVWSKFAFASVNPLFSFEDLIAPMRDRLSWMPVKDFRFEPSLSQDYMARANWALYVENYLEGFHIPFVHPSLAAAIDPRDYTTEVFQWCNLQISIAANPSDAFEIPASSPDHGRQIAAYYFWLFPNMMFNFYPWGLSMNIVVPLAVDRAKIRYLTYIWDESKLGRGAGANTDKVEREDEDIIELVQRGVQSRFYDRGRYSPDEEKGPHHFHRLLTRFLA